MVVVSVLPQAYFVERIAGGLVDIEVMIPPGAAPSIYEPTIEQMRAVSRAQLYVKVGHPAFTFERTWLSTLLESGDVRIVDGSAGMQLMEGDPHVWLSPANAGIMSKHIAAELTRVLPIHRTEIDAGLRDLLGEIDSVDGELRDVLAIYNGGHILVFHPAWGYFAAAYGLHQIAVEVDGKEPSPGDLARIVRRARRERVKVVFQQPQFSTEGAEVVAGEINGDVEVIDPLARDWPQNMRQVGEAIRRALDQ